MRFKYIMSIMLLLAVDAELSAREHGDATTDTYLAKSSATLGNPDLLNCDNVGETYFIPGGLVVNTDNSTFEFLSFSGKDAAFKTYRDRDGVIIGLVTGATQKVFNHSFQGGYENTSYTYSFTGMFDTNRYGEELRGTLTKKTTREADYGGGPNTSTCDVTYNFSSALSNPLTTKPTPVSPSIISILNGYIRSYLSSKSKNTRRVKERSTCCGVRG